MESGFFGTVFKNIVSSRLSAHFMSIKHLKICSFKYKLFLKRKLKMKQKDLEIKQDMNTMI